MYHLKTYKLYNIAHRRQAALNEVQRLKVEGTLRPVSPGSIRSARKQSQNRKYHRG